MIKKRLPQIEIGACYGLVKFEKELSADFIPTHSGADYFLLFRSQLRVFSRGKNFLVNWGRIHFLSEPFLGEIIDLSRKTAESVFFNWSFSGSRKHETGIVMESPSRIPNQG